MSENPIFKQKFYCEMCKKQCKDDNGFKQHCKTEYHKQQMILYAQNAQTYIEKFSKEFEQAFIDILKRSYVNKQVQANKVYKEYIKDRNNVHMNSTRWPTLGSFIDYLEKSNKIIQEFNESGSLITFIDKSPQAILEQKKLENFEKNQQLQKQILEKRQLEKYQKIIDNENQIYDLGKQKITEIKTNDLPEQFNININVKPKQIQNNIQKPTSIFQIKAIENKLKPKEKEDELQKRQSSSDIDFLLNELKRNKLVKTDLQSIQQNIEKQKPKLSPGIIVKLLKTNQKAIIKRVVDDYCIEVQILNDTNIQVVQQKDLQTVIPKIDGTVMILKQGQYYQKIGILEGIQRDNYSAAIQLLDENTCLKLKYDEFSKIP